MTDNPQPNESNPIDETAAERMVIPVGLLQSLAESIAALERRCDALNRRVLVLEDWVLPDE